MHCKFANRTESKLRFEYHHLPSPDIEQTLPLSSTLPPIFSNLSLVQQQKQSCAGISLQGFRFYVLIFVGHCERFMLVCNSCTINNMYRTFFYSASKRNSFCTFYCNFAANCRVDDDTYCDVTVDAPPFVPNQEDFSFDSFVWTDPAIANQLWICCDVYYCTEDAPGIDCSTALVVSQLLLRHRSIQLNVVFFPEKKCI